MNRHLLVFLLLLLPLFAQAKRTFTVEGPEDRYNQIRIVNETSEENFRCRLAVLNDDESTKEVYGVYELKERGDSDSATGWLYRGTRIALEMPKDFPVEVTFSVEYKDYPLFDVVIIHLFDNTTEFE